MHSLHESEITLKEMVSKFFKCLNVIEKVICVVIATKFSSFRAICVLSVQMSFWPFIEGLKMIILLYVFH